LSLAVGLHIRITLLVAQSLYHESGFVYNGTSLSGQCDQNLNKILPIFDKVAQNAKNININA
jgi:hypothetical protein